MAELSLNRARTIIRKVLAKGREEGFKPLSVVILDTGGHVKAFEREDGAAPGRFGIAAIAPPVDAAGNSVKAQLAIEYVSNQLNGNPYAVEPVAGSR